MGTKMQANAFFPKNHTVIDLNGSTRDGVRSLCHDNLIIRNGRDPDLLMPQLYQNGYSVYDMEKVRQTILKHESIFRNQLQELHRLYRRQLDLVNEIKMGDIKNAPILTLASPGYVSASSFSNSHLEQKDFFKNSSDGINRGLSLCDFGLKSERNWNELLLNGHAERSMDEHSGSQDLCSAKAQILPESLPAVPRNDILRSQLEIGESMLKKKGKIFGVEISEGNYNSCNAASNLQTTICSNDTGNFGSFWTNESVTLEQKVTPHLEIHRNCLLRNLEFDGKNVDKRVRRDEKNELSSENRFCDCAKVNGKCAENSKGGLPWFLKNTQYNGKPSKGMECSCFMNLDSLQNCSQQFFMKPEIEYQNLEQKQETSAPTDINEIKKDENDARNHPKTKDLNYVSNLRHQIDLNLSLDEEDAPSTTSLPMAIVKIATTEIDLEAPAVIESEPEPDASPKEVNSRKTGFSRRKSKIFFEERDKSAADALISISSSGKNNLLDDNSCTLPEASSTDCLEWFAEIISSQCVNSLNGNGEDSVPEGMDYFEFMTLKLEDVKGNERYLYNNPILLNVPSDEETGRGGTICKGSKRRGRQQKNFRKDVLPGLVTLSRLKMKEDLKAFEEIRKGEGHSWKSKKFAKKGKGMKHSVGPSSSALVTESRLVEGSLFGWGKRTRRLPRKRSRNLCHSLSVKC